MDRQNIEEAHSATVAQQLNALYGQVDKRRSAAIIRAVVRGERPVGDLAGAGLSGADAAACAEKCAGLPAQSADLAEGIMNLKGDREALSEWACFVVNAAEFFDYADQDIQCSQRLLSYIWQIPFGSGLSNRAITLATMVRNWPRRAA